MFIKMGCKQIFFRCNTKIYCIQRALYTRPDTTQGSNYYNIKSRKSINAHLPLALLKCHSRNKSARISREQKLRRKIYPRFRIPLPLEIQNIPLILNNYRTDLYIVSDLLSVNEFRTKNKS